MTQNIMKQKQKKHSDRTASVQRSLNKLLVQLIHRYIDMLKQHRIAAKRRTPATKSTLKLSEPAKIIVQNNTSLADRILMHEQQRDENKKQIPTDIPTTSTLVPALTAAVRTHIPTNTFSIKDTRTGRELIIPEEKMKEILENSTKAEKYREDATKAKDSETQAVLEAKATKLEKEAAKLEKEAIQKELGEKESKLLDAEIVSTQKSLGSKLLKKLWRNAVTQGILEDEKFTTSTQFIEALNSKETTKLFFTQISPPEGLNKTERKQYDKSIENSFNALLDAILQEGNGKARTAADGTLSNVQIEQLMKDKPNWCGIFSIDTLPDFGKDFIGNFIVNTSPITNPAVGHWVAVRVDPDTIEYYDPLGLKPTPLMYSELKRALAFGTGKKQFKINHMQDQNIHSNNCGWFAMKFLNDRARGRKWIEATGFNKLGEKEIENYKQKYDFKFV
ncbi:TPA_asm: adenain+ [Physarum slime mold MELD virus]|nr:TPA_asm: adenain+ [Physarum slime mold MELD virus]